MIWHLLIPARPESLGLDPAQTYLRGARKQEQESHAEVGRPSHASTRQSWLHYCGGEWEVSQSCWLPSMSAFNFALSIELLAGREMPPCDP
jgi:hypothetical protein